MRQRLLHSGPPGWRCLIMDESREKAKKAIKSLRMLEGVQKASRDAAQRARVKSEIEALKKMLREMYPGTDIETLKESLGAEDRENAPSGGRRQDDFNTLRGVVLEPISSHKSDTDINIAAGIMKHLEEKLWGVIADQHTKLDFSNAGIRDVLYRKLDQCGRALKMFMQTLDDIERTKSSDYGVQLQAMRTKQGRVFLVDFGDFLGSAKEFLSDIVADAESGGNMITNKDGTVSYASYETYRFFEGWNVLDAVRYLNTFIAEAIDYLNIPDLRNNKKKEK